MKKSDIIWYNSESGETQIWFMNDNRLVSRGTVVDENGNFIPIGPPWSIVGVGDMNGNGKSDIVWYNSQSGETQIWFMDGNRLVNRGTVVDEGGTFIPIGPPWSIVGVGGRLDALIAAHDIDREHWANGGSRGPLGNPLSDILKNGGVFVRNFEGEKIEWKNLEGATAYSQYFVRILYKGLHCFGETSGLGSDEPYAVVSAYNPASRERVKTIKFGPYENVEDGTSLPEVEQLWADFASDIAINTVVMEHDAGDHDRIRDKIQEALKKAADAAAAAFGVSTPPEWTNTITLGIAEGITSILGLGDDVIGQDTFLIRREELIDLANGQVIELKKFGSIEFNYPVDDATRPPISDNDASYKVYFEVTAGRFDEPKRIVR